MKENDVRWGRVIWKLCAVMVLAVGILLIAEPPKAKAVDCDVNYMNCIDFCPWPGTPNQTHADFLGCLVSCYTANSSCLDADTTMYACNNIFSECEEQIGQAVGGCYQQYANCESHALSRHQAEIQCVIQDDSPCRMQAVADLADCETYGNSFCPDGDFNCCSGRESAELALCTSCN